MVIGRSPRIDYLRCSTWRIAPPAECSVSWAASRICGHTPGPELGVKGGRVKVSANIKSEKVASHFLAGEIPGRSGIGGCRLVSHSTTAQINQPTQKDLATGMSATTSARETQRCNLGKTENRI